MSETGKLTDQKQGIDAHLPDPAPAAVPGVEGRRNLKDRHSPTKNGTQVASGINVLGHLPGWLAAARDSARVCQVLSAAVPEVRQGLWALRDCDVGHIRFKNQYWTALYKLTLQKPGADEEHEFLLQAKIYPPGVLSGSSPQFEGTLGHADWIARLPQLNLELQAREPEKVLAALGFLTDPQESRQFLEDCIRTGSTDYQDLRIKTCRPDVVRYKPGSRCTVVYHLGYDPQLARQQFWPNLVVAKTYRGEKGRNAFDSMAALWQSPLGASDLVTIAEPLAYHPDQKVLIQGPIAEDLTLKDKIAAAFELPNPETDQSLAQAMRQTAAGLAALHRSGVTLGRTWTWADELAEAQNQVDRLAEALPLLKAASTPLLALLDQLAAETPADPAIPAHGSFRPAQVLLHRGEIGFIDFDSFCQSEPANDLALFLGTVMSIGMMPSEGDTPTGRPADRQARFKAAYALCEQFLDDYQKDHPVSRQRVALWEALDIFTFVMHGWTKIKVREIGDIVYLLEQFLAVKGIGQP